MKSKLYAVLHFLLAWFVRLIFLIFPKGRRNEPKREEGPYIVCSNHLSALDPIIICAATRRQQPHFMAKKELFSIPVLSFFIKALGAYPVDRSGADAGVMLKTVKMLNDGYSVGMFPQGTRHPGADPSETPVRNGVGFICMHSKAQVLPIYIKTDKHRIRFLRPIGVMVGEPIPYEEYTEGGEKGRDAAYISKYIFSRICEIGVKSEKRDEKREKKFFRDSTL